MEVTVIRSRRKTIAVQVRQDGTVLVRAPRLMPRWEIRRFVESHQDWIGKQLQKQAAAQALRKETEPLSQQELKELAERARRDLTMRCAFWAEKVGVSYGRISIRHQKSRWGSCSSKGNLNFNCLLMLAPDSVRDYVVVHELCHRKEMNHSDKFYAEVLRVFPEYWKWDKWLKKNGSLLMMRMTK